MYRFWLDASALAKRYLPEIGSPLMNHLFSRVPPTSMVCLLEGVGEVISIFVRGRNRGTLPAVMFQQSMSRLDIEVIHNDDFEKYHPPSWQVTPSWRLIESTRSTVRIRLFSDAPSTGPLSFNPMAATWLWSVRMCDWFVQPKLKD